MNRLYLHNNLPENREIQNRFTAYVQEAMKNTRSIYYRKKLFLRERETVYNEADDLTITDSGDVLDALFSFNHAGEYLSVESTPEAVRKRCYDSE